ncbi:MAG TPA: DUF5654 family protein [Nitrosarchaeum sp.]|nr:DUF5654 family protein [Nitrosarchaeum sp.]
MKLANAAIDENGSVNPVGQFALILIGAASFITAFAWNNVAQELFNRHLKEKASITSMVLYALIVTVIACFVFYFISHLYEDYMNYIKRSKYQ